jgi:hypothetical protein
MDQYHQVKAQANLQKLPAVHLLPLRCTTLIMTDMEGISKTGIKSMNATIRLQPAVEVAITVSSYVKFVVMALKKGMRNVMMETETHLMGKFQAGYTF